MGETAMSRFRAGGGRVSFLLVLAFMLPILAGLVPMAPDASAEAALVRDLTSTICAPVGDAGGKPAPARKEHCCILCVTGTVPVDGPPLAGGIEARRLREADHLAPVPRQAGPVRRRLFASAISLRGPPAA
jgi:hypothetical protein